MGVIGIGVGDATLGGRTIGADGQVIRETPARWTENPAGGCVCIWPMNPETMKPDGAAEIFGDWQAAEYLARVVQLIHPNRKINVPDLEAMIRRATKDGFNICDYCPDCNCRDCIVNEWKGDPENE